MLSSSLLLLGLSACAARPVAVKSAKSHQHDSKATDVAASDDLSDPAVVFEVVSDLDHPLATKIDRRARNGQVRGHERSALAFRIADLPASVLKDPLEDKDAPTSIEGDSPADLIVKKNTANNYGYGYNGGASYQSITIGGNDLTSGSVRVGGSEGTFLNTKGTSTGGVTVQCAPWSRVMSARWEGLLTKTAQRPDSIYEIVDGWFDMKQCKAVEVRRSRIVLSELIPDTLYAFRQCTDFECSGKTSVVLVVPSASSAVSQTGPLRSTAGNALSRFVMPIRKGGSESVMATLPAAPGSNVLRTLSVEITQGTADAEPLATAFVSDVNN
jgi:hypothetical protein